MAVPSLPSGTTPPLADLVVNTAQALTGMGVNLPALGLAWARALPLVTIVPAFGLRALPAPARAILALALVTGIAPRLVPESAPSAPWPVRMALEVLAGLPLAVAVAAPLWAATMAGGAIDALRGAAEPTYSPAVEGRATALGVPLSLLASTVFLASGGPARAAFALATCRPPTPGQPIAAAAATIAEGITIAVGLATPLLVASIVLEIGLALVARAASPAHVLALLAPIRSVALLALLGIVFQQVANALASGIVPA